MATGRPKAVTDFNHLVLSLFFLFLYFSSWILWLLCIRTLPALQEVYSCSLRKGEARFCGWETLCEKWRGGWHLPAKETRKASWSLVWAPPSGWWVSLVGGGQHFQKEFPSLQKDFGRRKEKAQAWKGDGFTLGLLREVGKLGTKFVCLFLLNGKILSPK